MTRVLYGEFRSQSNHGTKIEKCNFIFVKFIGMNVANILVGKRGNII